MKIFLTLAWRNLWRNPQRSLIMIAGIAVGLFGLLVYHGISNGFFDEIVDTAIRLDLAHLQVHREGYLENPVPKNAFHAEKEMIDKVAAIPGVAAVSGRLQATVLISSAEKSRRVDLVGIVPEAEKQVTTVASSLVSGEYLTTGDDRRIFIGEELAGMLGVGPEDKLVVTAQDAENELQRIQFRVAGIFRSSSPTYDKTTAFVTLEAIQSFLNRRGQFTTLLVRADKDADISLLAQTISKVLDLEHSPLRVSTWWEVSPMLAESIEMFNNFVWIFYAIIYLAMAFGVVNILLMAVIDRTYELGVMRALGTSQGRILVMVLFEASLLGLVGIAAGGLAAWLVNGYLGTHGLDLSYWSAAMGFMGISNVIHSSITLKQWILAFLSAEAAVVVASIWPAWRASRLKPVEAILFR